MRKFAIGAALLSLVAGGVGYMLRYYYLTRAIEADTGLPVLSSPSLLAMVFYTAFVVVLAFALAYIAKRTFTAPEGYREAVAPINMFYLICMAAVYILLLTSGAIGIVQTVTAEAMNYVALIRAFLIVLTGASLFGLTYEAKGKKEIKGSLLYSIIPEIGITFWLLTYYRSNQTNPTLLSYVFFALALAASAFSFYFTAGYVYGRRSLLRLIFSYVTAIYFLITSLADSLPLSEKLCFAGLALFFIVNLSRYVGNMQKKTRQSAVSADIRAVNPDDAPADNSDGFPAADTPKTVNPE